MRFDRHSYVCVLLQYHLEINSVPVCHIKTLSSALGENNTELLLK